MKHPELVIWGIIISAIMIMAGSIYELSPACGHPYVVVEQSPTWTDNDGRIHDPHNIAVVHCKD